jgi:hypothetical protein
MLSHVFLGFLMNINTMKSQASKTRINIPGALHIIQSENDIGFLNKILGFENHD